MPTYLAPGIYVEETSSGTKPIAGASTSVAAFVGVAEKGPVGKATLVSSFGDFVKRFGGPIRVIEDVRELYLYYAVRHFFGQGGSRCYIVRVAGTAAIPAVKASAVLGSLTVSAISPGDWGEALSVRVDPTSRYSLLLEEDVALAATTLEVSANTDVRVGSLLWVVNDATGRVAPDGVVGNAVTFEIDIVNLNDGSATSFTIPDAALAYSPDFALDTTVNGAVNVTAGTAATVTLASVTKADGSALRAGDVVNFALGQFVAAVTKVGESEVGLAPNQKKVMEVTIAPAATEAFAMDRSRVYERGFSLSVRQGAVVVETHENLSLVGSDPIDHVALRLPPTEGRSFYVTADGTATTLMARSSAALTGGDDGLPSPAAGTNLDALVIGDSVLGTGLSALDKVKDASILCVTHASAIVANAAIAYCGKRKDMIYVVDPPRTAKAVTDAVAYVANQLTATSYAALYFPWIRVTDPFSGRQISVPPSGSVAGIYARSDAKRGVHKAPAGIDVGSVEVAAGTAMVLSKADNDTLHGGKVNAIRNLPDGILVWGARTLSADPEWVYVNVRRLFIFLEQSIERGTQWVAFEPNDESLWKKLRRNVSAFLRIQWREGKLVGETQEQAFYVKCDAETNPPEIVDAGMVVTEIGVAPSKPAEFVVFRIQQIAGRES